MVRRDVGRELAGGLVAPADGDFFRVERGELALGFVDEGKIEGEGLVGLAVAKGRLRLARVVVAVVIKKDDLTADLGLEFPRGGKFGVKEAPREETAGLLAEADDRCAHAQG